MFPSLYFPCSVFRTTLEIFNGLIQVCQASLLTFYAPSIVSVLQTIYLLDKRVAAPHLTAEVAADLKIHATETVRPLYRSLSVSLSVS